jgi:hypothetical protein
MKKTAVVIALAGTLMFTGAFLWRNAKVQAMSIQVNVKDLPEHGVRLIAPSDPSFDHRAQPFLKGQPQTMVDRIKPFSVIVENSGRLAIVGSCIKWEILKRDGTTSIRPMSSLNPRALMDGGELQTTGGAAIPPSSTRFVSLFGSAGEGQQMELNSSWLSFRGSEKEAEAFDNALAQGNKEEVFNRSDMGKLLREATLVTVSIDLVFFEDCTYVGDNQSESFIGVKAHIDARYDLATEVAVAHNQGKAPDEIFRQVGDIVAANLPTRNPMIYLYGGKQISKSDGAADTASRKYSEEYKFFKAIYAQELMRMKDALGAKEAISYAVKLLNRPRKELRRR